MCDYDRNKIVDRPNRPAKQFFGEQYKRQLLHVVALSFFLTFFMSKRGEKTNTSAGLSRLKEIKDTTWRKKYRLIKKKNHTRKGVGEGQLEESWKNTVSPPQRQKCIDRAIYRYLQDVDQVSRLIRAQDSSSIAFLKQEPID